MTDIISWSPVDASNNAAPPDGWPENMQPSAVNDSARAMMGAIRRYYDTLLSGSFVLPYLPITGGTISGNVTIGGNFTATGPSTFGTTRINFLAVTTDAYVDGVLYPRNGLVVTGNSGFSGAVTVSGGTTLSSLHVTGSTNLDGVLGASSISTTGNLSVTGNSTLTYLHVIGMSDLDGGVRISSGNLSVAGSANISAGAGVGGNLTVSGQTTINAGGSAALNVPNGGITAGGVSSFPYISGGPGAAGTLQTFGSGDRVCFRWDGYNLFSRIDETVEQRIPYANNFNGFDLGSGGGPTGYDLAAYSGSTPFILHVDIVSDRRLKENVRDTQVDALGAILATPVRMFDWSEAGRRYMPYIDPHAPIGLVAQEVQETMPWVVGVSNFKESDDVPVHDMHRVLHDRLTAYLVRAVQQLSARIDSLTTGENHV